MNKKEIAKRILGYLFPEFSNKVTWTVLIVGLGLLSSPLLEEIIRQLISENFKINITSGNDSILGFWLVVVAVIHNLSFKIVELRKKNIIVLDIAKNISQVRDLIDSVENFDEIKESSWWGFIETNLTDWEKQYITPPAMSVGLSIDPSRLSGDARKKQIVSQMLARLENGC